MVRKTASNARNEGALQAVRITGSIDGFRKRKTFEADNLSDRVWGDFGQADLHSAGAKSDIAAADRRITCNRRSADCQAF